MKKIICILFMFSIIMIRNNYNEESVLIPKESIRFRIIANSNNVEDQKLKLGIKNELQREVISKLSTNSYVTTKESIEASINTIDKVLKKHNISYNISYGENYFPEKSFKGVIYPKGEYQSLVVTLGEGLGDNWWCVLFPPLCLLEANEAEYSDVEYSLYTKEIINKFIH